MPLYLDDFEPTGLPRACVLVLVAIAAVVGDEVVNPASAMQLVRAFVRPLLPESQWPLLEIQGQPSWDRIHVLYPKLAFESRQGEDIRLLAAATVIDVLVRHTTRPPRDFRFPASVEVSSFTRIAGYLRLPVATPLVNIGGVETCLFDFCKSCWLPVFSHGVCRFHSTRNSIEAETHLPICASATLKQAQRLRKQFDAHVLALVSREELDFHNSAFEAPVLAPPSGLRSWLSQRRPLLARAIGPQPDPIAAHTLQKLLEVLYGGWASQMGAGIGAAAHLLTPITARAEGWLLARQARPSWGGARTRHSKPG